MTDRQYQRNPKTGRFARPVPDVDATSAFGPMGDSIEDISNVSAADVRPGMSFPGTDPLGMAWPVPRTLARYSRERPS